MEGVESKKVTTKFGNIVKFCIRAGSMTARKYFMSMTFFLNFNQNAFFLIQLQCITVHKYIFEWQSHDILGHTVFMNSYTFVNILILFISQQALHF